MLDIGDYPSQYVNVKHKQQNEAVVTNIYTYCEYYGYYKTDTNHTSIVTN